MTALRWSAGSRMKVRRLIVAASVVLIGGIWRGNRVEGLVMLHHRTARAATEKIKRGVVGDTETASLQGCR